MSHSFSSIPYVKPWKCQALQFGASSCRLLADWLTLLNTLCVFKSFYIPMPEILWWSRTIPSYRIHLSSHHSEEGKYLSSPSPWFGASLIVWFTGSFNKHLISAKPPPLPVFQHLSKWAYHSPWGWGVLAFIHLFSHTQVHQQVLPALLSKYV